MMAGERVVGLHRRGASASGCGRTTKRLGCWPHLPGAGDGPRMHMWFVLAAALRSAGSCLHAARRRGTHPNGCPPSSPRACSMSQYRAEQQRRLRAADEALLRWVGTGASLEAIRSDPRMPGTLLPELEGLWARRAVQQQQQQQQMEQGL